MINMLYMILILSDIDIGMLYIDIGMLSNTDMSSRVCMLRVMRDVCVMYA